MSLVSHLSVLPPYACRLLSKIPNREIARLSGLSLRTVVRISQMKSWQSVTLKNIDRYMKACGVNPMKINDEAYRLKRMIKQQRGLDGTWHLHKSKRLPLWEKAARAKRLKVLVKLLQ